MEERVSQWARRLYGLAGVVEWLGRAFEARPFDRLSYAPRDARASGIWKIQVPSKGPPRLKRKSCAGNAIADRRGMRYRGSTSVAASIDRRRTCVDRR